LAGSERQSHTQGFGPTDFDKKHESDKQLKEAIEINKSLFTLRQVVTALTENSQRKSDKSALSYVPYRESKLTTLLRQSLGGNSYTLMIACVAPIDLYLEENVSTLNYAARASMISNAPAINMDPQQRKLAEAKAKIKSLQEELRRANDTIKFLTQGGCQCKLTETQYAGSTRNNFSDENKLKFPMLVESQDLNKTVSAKGSPNAHAALGVSTSQFSALQSQFRKTTGLLSDDTSNFAQDRLISSISVIKEVLQSNMQLRDELLNLSQQTEQLN
jgi:hypothetical protein